MNDPDALSISKELAMNRTLALEFRSSIERNKKEQAETFFDIINSIFEAELDEESCQKALETVKNTYNAVFQPLSNLTVKEAETMMRIYKTSAEIAEKARKIQENITVKLEMSPELQNTLVNFVVTAVMPYVPLDLRGKMSQSVMAILPQIASLSASEDSEVVYE